MERHIDVVAELGFGLAKEKRWWQKTEALIVCEKKKPQRKKDGGKNHMKRKENKIKTNLNTDDVPKFWWKYF